MLLNESPNSCDYVTTKLEMSMRFPHRHTHSTRWMAAQSKVPASTAEDDDRSDYSHEMDKVVRALKEYAYQKLFCVKDDEKKQIGSSVGRKDILEMLEPVIASALAGSGFIHDIHNEADRVRTAVDSSAETMPRDRVVDKEELRGIISRLGATARQLVERFREIAPDKPIGAFGKRLYGTGRDTITGKDLRAFVRHLRAAVGRREELEYEPEGEQITAHELVANILELEHQFEVVVLKILLTRSRLTLRRRMKLIEDAAISIVVPVEDGRRSPLKVPNLVLEEVGAYVARQ